MPLWENAKETMVCLLAFLQRLTPNASKFEADWDGVTFVQDATGGSVRANDKT